MDNCVVEVKGVSKVYGKTIKTVALDKLDLGFKTGSFNAIIGESGSGKSTLLNIMGTLDRPTKGDVIINGVSTKNMSKGRLDDLRNETLGFVFQFHYLLPEFTALENVLMPYRIAKGKADKKSQERAKEILSLVGLEKVENNLATNMSGGQQQRTAIARALMNQPKIILADEPTGNLDSQTTDSIYQLFRRINQELGTTFVIITHDRRVAEKADRIIEILDGRISLDIVK
ncbi:ABC transporter ATP-binding protein [Acetobacterium carbinolicum]|jgi:lipoprotein-releasing system ATP-binding protein|uniref:ABC transporter ATP-binding protein n=1 Tax=Acetobacterium TaxID=33951 RepID=UPI000DBEB624|nr:MULTISPECIES: ABC transporter ATP-binding protein [unclassified Acetobacterium]AWW27944.1 lipoprotein-releasing system ATP-binding protein LolD [Acetobacterium sp. KB-1]MDK2942987.1 lipoprotein-releasing system ATP-binding protein [Acetobacterium sp.]MDZ5726735.1 ABC transporter ATP-binding protein [Acetobacterium sp. K1/6]